MAATDFIASTTYPIDKISGYQTGSTTVAATSTASPTAAHSLGYKPLYFIKWSTTPTFETSFDEIGVSTLDNLQLTAQTDETTLYLFINNNSASSVTFYYRVIYFMPPDVNLDADETTSALDTYNKNTNFNYTKVFDEDNLGSGNRTIAHNLGYYPQAEVWYERDDGKLLHLVSNQVTASASNPTAEMTTAALILKNNGVTITKWYYRIYVDEN